MEESELKEILELLKASGMEARLCDTPIGLVDNPKKTLQKLSKTLPIL